MLSQAIDTFAARYAPQINLPDLKRSGNSDVIGP
jgi:hypothetical protein